MTKLDVVLRSNPRPRLRESRGRWMVWICELEEDWPKTRPSFCAVDSIGREISGCHFHIRRRSIGDYKWTRMSVHSTLPRSPHFFNTYFTSTFYQILLEFLRTRLSSSTQHPPAPGGKGVQIQSERTETQWSTVHLIISKVGLEMAGFADPSLLPSLLAPFDVSI